MAALLKSLFFIPYMNHGIYSPLLFLGWSLNYEMYFYLLIAAAMVVHRRAAPLIAAGLMIAVLLVLRVLGVSDPMKFYAHPIILEFVAGIFCYHGFRAISKERILAHRGLLFGAAAVAAFGMVAAAITTLGSRNAVIVGFTATVLVFAAVLLDKAGLSLRWPFLILLGDASYAMYLIHPYCQQGLNKVVARVFPLLNTKTLPGMMLGMAVTIVASVVLYYFVDNPLHLYFRNLLCKPAAFRAGGVSARPIREQSSAR